MADPGFSGGGGVNPSAGANLLLPTAREGNVLTAVCPSTIGLMDTARPC